MTLNSEKASNIAETDRNLLWRLWVYQKERFPLVAHVPLILAFSFCAASFSARLRADAWPVWPSVGVAFVSCLIFFLQLRIADEIKDAQEDARWRPYRAVPRGLITLGELSVVFIIGAIVQLCLAMLWSGWLSVLLLVTWLYLAAMSFEFGARKWLKAHPITYMWTHMLIMPLIDFYASATDWIVSATPYPPKGLIYFLVASFFNGIVIEIGRKIRVPSQEEQGVETYSSLWGPQRAAIVWWLAVAVTAAFACMAAHKATALAIVAVPLIAVTLLIGIYVIFFILRQQEKIAKGFELAAALWTLCLYLSLGILPGVFTHA